MTLPKPIDLDMIRDHWEKAYECEGAGNHREKDRIIRMSLGDIPILLGALDACRNQLQRLTERYDAYVRAVERTQAAVAENMACLQKENFRLEIEVASNEIEDRDPCSILKHSEDVV